LLTSGEVVVQALSLDLALALALALALDPEPPILDYISLPSAIRQTAAAGGTEVGEAVDVVEEVVRTHYS
jgi:hypothetical protein